MCIAILKTKNGVITDEELRSSFKNNSDGAGIAYTSNNELRIVKGIFNVDVFIKTVRQAEKLADNNILIHCRIGTSGQKDKNNTHPFVINNNICLIHNGILDVTVPKGSKINDTQIFIKKFMKGIANDTILKNQTYHNVLEELIGCNNKFVILNNKGEYKIINENAGHWKDGVWFSNSSYQRTSYKSFFGTGYAQQQFDYYKKYYDFYDDESEYYEDYYVEKYKKYLSPQDEEVIIDAIQELTYERVKEFNYDVYYDTATKELITRKEAEEYTCDCSIEALGIYALEDLSKELYDLYIDFAEEIMAEVEVA